MEISSLSRPRNSRSPLSHFTSQSSIKTNNQRNIGWCMSGKESLKSMSTYSNSTQDLSDLERRVEVLEEENRTAIYENSLLRNENKKLKTEKQKLIEDYEEQLRLLKLQIENNKPLDCCVDMPLTKVFMLHNLGN